MPLALGRRVEERALPLVPGLPRCSGARLREKPGFKLKALCILFHNQSLKPGGAFNPGSACTSFHNQSLKKPGGGAFKPGSMLHRLHLGGVFGGSLRLVVEVQADI